MPGVDLQPEMVPVQDVVERVIGASAASGFPKAGGHFQ